MTNLAIVNKPDDTILKSISDGLSKFNQSCLGEVGGHFAVILKSSVNEIIGASSVHTTTESAYVDMLWVSDQHRSCGYGRQILQGSEEEARNRNCQNVILDTYSFQAPEFYIKCGYQQFATVPEYILGHDKIFFRKAL